MRDFVDKQEYWNELYINCIAGWDLKSPTPVFQRILKEKKIINTGKILIMGSAYGYDAVEAAKNEFNVTAVDFSESAINFSILLAKKKGVKIKFLAEDYFELAKNYSDKFDVVYDYVTYCAIDSKRRREYAKLVSELLECGGIFIALWFPVGERTGGPPFAINLKETNEDFFRLSAITILFV